MEDKNVDAYELGVGMGLGENGRIAFAHKSYDAGTWVMATDSYTGDDPNNDVTIKSNYIAGQYSIGGMTAYLGFAQHKGEDKTLAIMLGNRLIKLLLQASEVQLQTRVYRICFKQEARNQKATLLLLLKTQVCLFLQTNTHHG